jgi:hypothetical protein
MSQFKYDSERHHSHSHTLSESDSDTNKSDSCMVILQHVLFPHHLVLPYVLLKLRWPMPRCRQISLLSTLDPISTSLSSRLSMTGLFWLAIEIHGTIYPEYLFRFAIAGHRSSRQWHATAQWISRTILISSGTSHVRTASCSGVTITPMRSVLKNHMIGTRSYPHRSPTLSAMNFMAEGTELQAASYHHNLTVTD